MVESEGVEPLSENRPRHFSERIGHFPFPLARAPAQRVPGLVASSLAVKGQSFPPNRGPPNGVFRPTRWARWAKRRSVTLRVRLRFCSRLFFLPAFIAVPAPAARLPGVTRPRRNRYAPCTCYFCRSRNARSISRASSPALAAARLSYSFLPPQTPTSSFALFLEK